MLFRSCYGCQELYLGPLSEVVYCNNSEFDLTLGRWEWSDYVDTPLGEWPGAKDWSQLLGLAVNHTGIPLKLVASFNVILRVPGHGRPVIPLQ